MKEIKAYQTSDGKIFEQLSAAQVNEALYQFLKKADDCIFADTSSFVDRWDTTSIFQVLQEHFPTAIEAIIGTAAESIAEEIARELSEEAEFGLGNKPPTSVL